MNSPNASEFSTSMMYLSLRVRPHRSSSSSPSIATRSTICAGACALANKDDPTRAAVERVGATISAVGKPVEPVPEFPRGKRRRGV